MEPVGLLVVGRKPAVARPLLRLVDCDIRQFVSLEAAVAIQLDAVGEPGPFFVADLLVVLLALIGRAQVLDLPVLQAADKVVLHGVAFFYRCSGCVAPGR